jgi:hypothetical protein
MAKISESNVPATIPQRCENKPEAVQNEGVASEHVEQQNPLKYLGYVQRDFHCDLGLLAANEGECEEKTCN